MEAYLTVAIFVVTTILVFIFTEPRKRPELGTIYWNTQQRLPNELAKSFAYSGEGDRIIEMLNLQKEYLPNAQEFHAAAAKTGVPMLFKMHKVSWRETEQIIQGLLNCLAENTFEVTHAFVVLDVGGNLGSLEDTVTAAMLNQMDDSDVVAKEDVLVRYCVSLSYLEAAEAINPLVKLMNNDSREKVRNAARYSLQKMGFNL